MSMLVGLRGQSRESEAAALREGIIQQPGPFYNGNPSSIIWGGSPTAPLWRDDNSTWHVREEEKEKGIGRMTVGEGKTSSKGRRHVSRTQFTRNLSLNAALSSPFAFGFPPQPPPPSVASSSSGLPRIPTVVASGGSFVACGACNDYAPRVVDTGPDSAGEGPGVSIAQDERMEDFEAVIPLLANLAVKDRPSNLKVSLSFDEHLVSSEDLSADGSDVSGKLSALNLNSSFDTPDGQENAPVVFVFGAKPPSNQAASASQKASVAQGQAARSRTLKVKRSVSAAKGKGLAASNGASSAPRPKGLHPDGSHFVTGECSFSRSNCGCGNRASQNAEFTNDESSSLEFISPSCSPISAKEVSMSGTVQQSSSQVQSPRQSGRGDFVFPRICKGVNSSRDPNANSKCLDAAERSFKSKDSEQVSTMGHYVSTDSKATDGSCISSELLNSVFAGSDNSNKSVSANREFAPSHKDDAKTPMQYVDDLSSGFAQKLGLKSINVSPGKEMTADHSRVGRAFNTEDVGSSEDGTLSAVNAVCESAKSAGGKQDSQPSSLPSSSPISHEVSRVAKEATVDIQKPFSRSSTYVQSEPFTTHTVPKPFVFGASRPTKTATEAPLLSPFKFTAKASPLFPLPSSTGGSGVSTNANITASDLLSSQHKGSVNNSLFHTDAVASSFSCFNLGSAKPSVRSDSAIKSEGVVPAKKIPTTPRSFASFENFEVDFDGGNSSCISVPSHFVFSAGSGATSSQASSSTTPATKDSGAFTAVAPIAENKVKEIPFPVGSTTTSEILGAQFRSQPSGMTSKSFEFRANSGDGSGNGRGNVAKKKSHRTLLSGPRRQSRSLGMKEKDTLGAFNLVDTAQDEAGSPMDFSPQQYTPPEDALPEMDQTLKQPSWDKYQPMEKDGLNGGDEWVEYSETDLAIENIRNAASNLDLGSKQGGRAAWQGIGRGEEDSLWWGGKENSPGKVAGRNCKSKRAALDENQVPLSGRDNTWAGVKVDSAQETESAASSSTPSVGSSASSSGWGHFTFTAGSSPKFLSDTSLLRRHARRIQRNKPAGGAADVIKSASTKVEGETIPSTSAGVKQVVRRVLSETASLPRQDGVGPAIAQSAGAAAAEQLCERWRLRGNQAYANGDFPKAEEYYSRGASSVPPNETSQSCIRASMLCYSNRAATRMVVGRMREALADCMRAMTVDPNFLRVRLRAASCHLALGEIEPAVLAFRECIRRAKEEAQPDMKVSSEASEGLRKALQVEEYLNRASEILANWNSGDTPTAVRLLNEALLSSPHSERALELKSRGLLLLRRYDEVVQLCEQSLITAQRNHPSASGHQGSLHMWRWQVIAKAKYNLGRLEEALEILQKLVELASVGTADRSISTGNSPNGDPWALSITGIRDLLRHKAAGNEAFQNGKHSEAVEHYSAALACNGDSRPFNAVCFCNRAAASQALGNIADAIADCSRAIALDPKYAKAISRRATLHEKVRDYGQSCNDLQRLVTLLEAQQQQEKVPVSPGRVGRLTTNAQQDLRQARERLAKAEDEMKKGHPLDHYMILGLEPSCSSNEIKKAYRKAALRHHPDKAGQFLARSEGGDDGGLWKDVADEVRRDAERLFKLIGEANAILSDTQKRTRYDAEEEFRKLRTRTGSGGTGGLSEMYRSTERGPASVGRRPRDRWDSWNGYGHHHQRWQSGPDAAQPDTYARRGRYGSNSSSRSNGDGGRWTEYDWDDI